MKRDGIERERDTTNTSSTAREREREGKRNIKGLESVLIYIQFCLTHMKCSWLVKI